MATKEFFTQDDCSLPIVVGRILMSSIKEKIIEFEKQQRVIDIIVLGVLALGTKVIAYKKFNGRSFYLVLLIIAILGVMIYTIDLYDKVP